MSAFQTFRNNKSNGTNGTDGAKHLLKLAGSDPEACRRQIRAFLEAHAVQECEKQARRFNREATLVIPEFRECKFLDRAYQDEAQKFADNALPGVCVHLPRVSSVRGRNEVLFWW